MAIPFAQLSFPELYEQALVGPLFRPWAEDIIKQVDLARGERVLDIACGTGIVARLAKDAVGDHGTVVGVDVSPAMIAVASRITPAVDWRTGDAAALPLHAGEQFDAVVCQQGLQFFPDRSTAAQQMHRALVPEGRLAASTWRSDDEFVFLRELRRVAESHVGPIDDRRHSFADAAPLVELFEAAGFRDVACHTVSRTIRFADGSVFVRLNAMALVSMSGASANLADAEREQLVADIVRDSKAALRAASDATGLAYELAANVVTARK